MSRARLPIALLILTATAGADPVLAQPGWGGRGWGGGGDWGDPGAFGDRTYGPRRAGPDAREGKVQVGRFLAEDIDPKQLGQGRIGVGAMPGGTGDTRRSATFEAAVLDQLAKAGYDTLKPDLARQIAEVSVIDDVVRPEEPKRRPVSGETTVGVSNRGTYLGMAIAVDATKPARALISTRLLARIRDRASGKLLWEGRADIVTREGDSHWTEQAIATRLAAALFAGFPRNG